MEIRPLIPLLIAAGILLGGNGVQGTLIALRGAYEGFSPTAIGLTGTAYFGGFLLSCLVITRILNAVGHIRTFAALSAMAAASTLLLAMIVEPATWILLRFIAGFCFAGLFTTIESWLNSGVRNNNRGRMLALYRIIDILAVTGAQFFIPLFSATGFTIFAVITLMVMLSVVPVSLADRSAPKPPETVRFDLKTIWLLSPLACIGCVAIGATNSAFRLIGPLYAEEIGLSVTDVATFMSAGIIGGAVLQYPFGYISDRYDRRIVLMFVSAGAVFAGMFITFIAGTSPFMNYLGIFVFGAFALPLYSLSAAHANDHAKPDQFVLVAAGLFFFFALGGMIGPFLSSAIVELYGASGLFAFTSVVHTLLIIVALLRMQARGPVPEEDRKGFRPLLRTSAQNFKLSLGARTENGSTTDKPSDK
ncbi:MFS transporter [Ahrensia marina]|uniref:MFS transporter n=1 Tax=Ahrensia marina TaxID=1514904 RepID=A0A0N0VLP2_9HYPH|nr:MFS transporter [Ahrensia marina]KPB01718.1 MFS transporter [Ahrensia marina]